MGEGGLSETKFSENEKQPVHDDDRMLNLDENVLTFMDSLDAYLSLVDSLSSTLRQGWFEFASARYSMGALRVSSALLDLTEHPAATSLEVTKDEEPHFTLCKWKSFDVVDSGEMHERLLQKSNSVCQRVKDTCQASEVEEDSLPVSGASITADDQVRNQRSKSLAVFGTLVSPRLRAAQLSFETALETLIKVANARASMLCAFDKVEVHVNGTKN